MARCAPQPRDAASPIAGRSKHNVVRQKSFFDRLIDLMNRYRNQHLTAAEKAAIELVIAQMETFAEDWSPAADH
ncbi:type I restriction enzyme endonuclease domain-containing protein [Frankia sp. Cr2]|uniref:type I restriction enzyme endonuclease domain-containing protein n=1 Tax=Frankia sp. Cr2 TaxID=3073932 RepID=UPI002AD23B23|nr:type I restriction enzyme endonuclease domain-containing protein [Frankia sp. Cr2]